ncbi:MAG: HEAT repeat domain-containing protein [Deltaproteobacteria bacterium]
MSKCPGCGKDLDDNNLLRCPHCNIDVPTYIKVNLDNLKKSQDFLSGYKQGIDAEVNRKVRDQIRKYIAALCVLCLGGIALIYLSSQSLTGSIVSAKLNQQLQQPQIKQTLIGAAQENIKKEILPEIEVAKESAAKEFTEFKSYLENEKAQLGQEYATLATQVEVLKTRNRLAQLANVAISEGSRQALQELEDIAGDPNKADLAEVANAEVMRVKAFFATTSRLKEQTVKYNNSEGIVIVDDKIPTATLISDLRDNPDWRVRAKFAELLAIRNEEGVAQALLEAAASDENLYVMKAALEAFATVTGFKSSDIFDYKSAREWWDKNKNTP